MVHRQIVPTSAIEVAEKKRESNISAVVPVSAGAEVYIKPKGSGDAGRGGRIVVRGTHVKPSHKLGTKAKAMKACAGKPKSEFASCLDAAGIKSPRSLHRERKAK